MEANIDFRLMGKGYLKPPGREGLTHPARHERGVMMHYGSKRIYRELTARAVQLLAKMWKLGAVYTKAGVVLAGL